MHNYADRCKHRPHVKVINKKGELVCAKDGVTLSKKPRIESSDDMSPMMGKYDPDVMYVEPHEVLYSSRKPDGWKKAFDKAAGY